jgi:hypothetical protein
VVETVKSERVPASSKTYKIDATSTVYHGAARLQETCRQQPSIAATAPLIKAFDGALESEAKVGTHANFLSGKR